MIKLHLPKAQWPSGCKKLLLWAKQFPVLEENEVYGVIACGMSRYDCQNDAPNELESSHSISFPRQTDCIYVKPSCPAEPEIIRCMTSKRRPVCISLLASDGEAIRPEGFNSMLLDSAMEAVTGVCIFEGLVNAETMAALEAFLIQHERTLVILTCCDGGEAWRQYLLATYSQESPHEFLTIIRQSSSLSRAYLAHLQKVVGR